MNLSTQNNSQIPGTQKPTKGGGERERGDKPNSNYLRTKTQISENMIALFPRSTKSGSLYMKD